MKAIVLILICLSFLGYSQTTSIVTENYLRLNFTPKNGVTPGTENTLAMDCDQILARYNVTISGVTTTGTRLPSQTQLTASCSLPTVNYVSQANLTSTSNDITSYISSDGGCAVTERGVCAATTWPPTAASPFEATNGTGNGSYTVTLSGLSPGTLYYFAPYAINSVGTQYDYYGSQSFTTLNVPTMATTTTADYRTSVAFSSGGSITSDGGSSITAKGVCYGTSANPTVSGTKTNDGTGTASFTSSITGLTQNTLYYYRSYATNSIGTAYGPEYSFTTQYASVSYLNSTSWTCPTGVRSVTVECQGGGGAGGSATGTASRAGGGAGGTYSTKVLTVTPGNSYTITVGAAASASTNGVVDGSTNSFSTLCVANGGKGAAVTTGTSGSGATAVTTGSVGTTINIGGNGGNGTAGGYSGGGGGGAGSTGAGNNASLQTAGAAKSASGGKGGDGVNVANTRNAGAVYGAGGSGGLSSNATDRAGGNGSIGFVILNFP